MKITVHIKHRAQPEEGVEGLLKEIGDLDTKLFDLENYKIERVGGYELSRLWEYKNDQGSTDYYRTLTIGLKLEPEEEPKNEIN